MCPMMKQLVFVFAAVGVATLAGITWVLARLSSWIVYRDHVWNQMDAEGGRLEHGVAEAFHAAGSLFPIPMVVTVVGTIFLVFLWRVLSLPKATGGPATGT